MARFTLDKTTVSNIGVNHLYRGPSNNRISGWSGPDTFGAIYAMNPAHPEVITHFSNYLAALINIVCDLVDGFVWDESFYLKEGAMTLQPAPAYCDVAFMKISKLLRDQVKANNQGRYTLSVAPQPQSLLPRRPPRRLPRLFAN